MEKQLEYIKKNGYDLVLSKNGNYISVYRKNKIIGSIYNTKNSVFFMGKEFIETTGRDLIAYLKSLQVNV